MCWTPLYTNNVNKTGVFLQTSGGKDKHVLCSVIQLFLLFGGIEVDLFISCQENVVRKDMDCMDQPTHI